MLVLSRKLNESIVIAGNIRITVTSIRGQCVRLGIEAPEEVGIYREELFLDPAPAPVPSNAPIQIRHYGEGGRNLRPIPAPTPQFAGHEHRREISFKA